MEDRVVPLYLPLHVTSHGLASCLMDFPLQLGSFIGYTTQFYAPSPQCFSAQLFYSCADTVWAESEWCNDNLAQIYPDGSVIIYNNCTRINDWWKQLTETLLTQGESTILTKYFDYIITSSTFMLAFSLIATIKNDIQFFFLKLNITMIYSEMSIVLYRYIKTWGVSWKLIRECVHYQMTEWWYT